MDEEGNCPCSTCIMAEEKRFKSLKADADRLLLTITQFNKPEKLNEEQKSVIRLCEFVLDL